MVRGSEEHLVCSRPKECARGFSSAGRNAMNVTGLEAQDINLVEWILRLARALENELLPIRRKIALTTFTLVGELADILKKARFRFGPCDTPRGRQHDSS